MGVRAAVGCRAPRTRKTAPAQSLSDVCRARRPCSPSCHTRFPIFFLSLYLSPSFRLFSPVPQSELGFPGQSGQAGHFPGGPAWRVPWNGQCCFLGRMAKGAVVWVALKPLCPSLGHWSPGLDHGLESRASVSLFRERFLCFPFLLPEAWSMRRGCGPVTPWPAVLNLFGTFPLGPSRAASTARDEGLRPGPRSPAAVPG